MVVSYAAVSISECAAGSLRQPPGTLTDTDSSIAHAQALISANHMGIMSEISVKTEDEPLGMYEIPPPAEMEIQDQARVTDIQERPSQSEMEISDESAEDNDNDSDKRERVEKTKKKGCCLRRMFRALCCCFPKKSKKVEGSTDGKSEEVICQEHGRRSTSSNIESEAAASSHSTHQSDRSGGRLHKHVQNLTRMRIKRRSSVIVPGIEK
ncbi:Hypothetical predicted protein [Pelobates cultripes]|uniref:Uncharacterized protein n=1 Tax=Pelobates cultripes TaxID=61616 RepID=A0AAD1WC98_PELCU|nr:Hypothetical predicted protein [Pelobates cultripes]